VASPAVSASSPAISAALQCAWHHVPPPMQFFFPCSFGFSSVFRVCLFFGFGRLGFLGVSCGFWVYLGRVVRDFAWVWGVCWVGVLLGQV